VPYEVDATVSDILMVNPADVIDVFSLIPLQLLGLTCCYKAAVWLSKGVQGGPEKSKPLSQNMKSY